MSPAIALAQQDSLVFSYPWLVLTSPAGSEPAGLQWTLQYSAADVVSITAVAGPAAITAGKSLQCAAVTSTTITIGGTSYSGLYTCILSGVNSNIIPNGIVAVTTIVLSNTVTGTYISITNALGASLAADAIAIASYGGTVGGIGSTISSGVTLAAGSSIH